MLESCCRGFSTFYLHGYRSSADADSSSKGLDPTCTPEHDETSAAAAAAAAAATPTEPVSAVVVGSVEEDSSTADSINTQLSSSAVGEAGTYSRMLPKGWGPRLGVGFSRYPRSRNNIVSSASLGGMSKTAAAPGDALSGAAGDAV